MNINYTNESKVILNENFNLQYDFNELSKDNWARVSDKDEIELAAENNKNNDNKSSENGDFSEIFGKFWNISFLSKF